MTTKFELDFIKFYPKIQEEYDLSPNETLIYGYVTEVIDFQKNVEITLFFLHCRKLLQII